MAMPVAEVFDEVEAKIPWGFREDFEAEDAPGPPRPPKLPLPPTPSQAPSRHRYPDLPEEGKVAPLPPTPRPPKEGEAHPDLPVEPREPQQGGGPIVDVPVGSGKPPPAGSSPFVMAWYIPRHFSRTHWGIYISEKGIQSLASNLLWELRRKSYSVPANPVDAVRYATYFLMRHEAFHFTLEVYATGLEAALVSPKYLPYDSIYQSQRYTSAWVEEVLANYSALARAQVGSSDLTSAFLPFVRSQPPGYRDAAALLAGGYQWTVTESRNVLANHVVSSSPTANSAGAAGAFILPTGVFSILTSYANVPRYLFCDLGGVFAPVLSSGSPVPVKFRFRPWP